MPTTCAAPATISARLLLEPAIVTRLKLCALQRDRVRGDILHAVIRKKDLLKNAFVASSLLNVYTKCGALAKAKEIYDEVRVHDVVTCTTLIAGYAHHGLDLEALGVLDAMRRDGPCPNAATFVCALKSCGNIRAIEKGHEIHTEIVQKGLLDNNDVLCTAIVGMYAKCGAIESAQLLFDELYVRDHVAWSSCINIYANDGSHEKAEKSFKQMQLEGFPPNAVTFSCMLNAYGLLGASEKGKQIHSVIVKEGFLELDLVLGSALIEFYLKCGTLTKVQKVFDDLPSRNVVLWTELATGYLLRGSGKDAVLCFDYMKIEGIHPNAITFAGALQACGSMGAYDKGQSLHAEVVQKGFVGEDMVLGNALTNMYVRCSALSRAQAIFQGLKDQSVESWNALMSAYCHHGHAKEALYILEHMQATSVRPDQVTFLCALQACGHAGIIARGRVIHSEIVKAGLVHANNQLENALVQMYCKYDLADAQKMFDELIIPDTVSWNVLIAGYCMSGQEEEALSCMEKMQNEGILPDPPTCARILKVCGTLGLAEKGKEIHIELERRGLLQNDIILGTALMDMYGKCNELVKAREAFDCIPLKDFVTWTAFIAGCCQHGYFEESLNCFELMHHIGIVSDMMTSACILKACGHLGIAEKGIEIFSKAVREGFQEEDSILACALLGMYAKCGVIDKAQEVFAHLTCRDVVAWTTLISMYAQLEKPNLMCFFFDKMVEDGVMPNSITFTVVLHACGYLGLQSEGEGCFEFMSLVYNITPSIEHHTCMVTLFAKSGELDKACELIRIGSLSNYLPAWLSLLRACQKWENWKLGILAFFNALRLNATDALAFVHLSSLYAAGMHVCNRKAYRDQVNTGFSFFSDGCKNVGLCFIDNRELLKNCCLFSHMDM